MKRFLIVVLFFFIWKTISFGQVAGNVNYQNKVKYANVNINAGQPQKGRLLVSVKGLANVKADSYVVVFSVAQTGKSAKEVNSLIDGRIDRALHTIKSKPGVKTYVDMISFVPVYEYNITKKIFSKKTYNEIPTGFELKKNIHIEFTNPGLLKQIINDLSEEEIYNLVKLDYFSKNIEKIRKDLRQKAASIIDEKLRSYQRILQISLDSMERSLIDGYVVKLPLEMYKSYQSYSSTSLDFQKGGKVNQAKKATNLYYQPIVDKEFDFVLNPVVLEPVIQVMYEVKVSLDKRIKPTGQQKAYMLVTPNGDIRQLNIRQ